MTFDKILIVGLGQLGLPAARYVKEIGFDTYGYDINPKAMEIAERTVGIKQATDFGINNFDVYVINVSTHKPDDMSSPQIDGLLSIVHKISREAKKDGALVSIESTVPKGTSKKVSEILNHRLHVVYAPHRWYALEEKEHGINQLRVIGGVCDCCLRIGLQFYCGNNDGGEGRIYPTTPYKNQKVAMHPVSEVEIAEITKIAENAHRYLQIAFAEELYLYCQANNINFPELRDALNTKWNVEILEAREGIAKHNLLKDTKMFLQSTSQRKSKILTAAMKVDKDYKRYRAKLEQHLESSIEHNSVK